MQRRARPGPGHRDGARRGARPGRRCSCTSARPQQHHRCGVHRPVRLDVLIAPSTVPVLIASARSLIVIVALARGLLLSSLSPDVAAAAVSRCGRSGRPTWSRWPSRCRCRAGDRGGAEHGAADRPGRRRAAHRQGPVRAMVVAALHRGRRHLDRHPAGLRQLLLDRARSRLAGELFIVALVVVVYLLTLPAPARRRVAPRAATPAWPGSLPAASETNRGGGSRCSRLHGEHLIAASIVAVIAGVVGFFAVLRGSLRRPRHPNGAFAGAPGPA